MEGERGGRDTPCCCGSNGLGMGRRRGRLGSGRSMAPLERAFGEAGDGWIRRKRPWRPERALGSGERETPVAAGSETDAFHPC
jgi:hypothetical protein